MFGISQEQFLGIVRHIVTFAGGVIVAKWRVDGATIETLGGVVVTLAGVIWSFAAKRVQPAPEAPAIAAATPTGVQPS